MAEHNSQLCDCTSFDATWNLINKHSGCVRRYIGQNNEGKMPEFNEIFSCNRFTNVNSEITAKI